MNKEKKKGTPISEQKMQTGHMGKNSAYQTKKLPRLLPDNNQP